MVSTFHLSIPWLLKRKAIFFVLDDDCTDLFDRGVTISTFHSVSQCYSKR